MKKITLLLSIIAIVFSSCKDKNAYTINGNFNATNLDGKIVYLQAMDDFSQMEPTVLDSATVKDGKFHFEGIAGEKPAIRFISLGKLAEMETPDPNQATVATFVLEPGTIDILLDKATLEIKGTPRNDAFNKVHALSNQMVALYKEVSDAGGVAGVPLDSNGLDAKARMEKIMKDMQDVNYQFTKENMNNPVGEFIFMSSARSFEEDQIKELISLSDSSFQNKPEIKDLLGMFEMQSQRNADVLNQPYKDVQLTDQNGKSVALSTYVGKGKVVFLDFWASWCGPCMQEVPHLVQAYAKYKSKGFEIVGISLDEDKAAWTNAVKTNNMSWTQLIDADKSAAETYGISAIPYTLLVDGNGTIIAMNLRGDDLDKKLAELLK
ncbi:TlpA disulfide reductase family protein [Dysgonomonas sp. ZJ709]|uniref:TlpA disulfide reductase family protein n=1 Tax=Dysgonomonas sp. ZJ709 TaxID=2709797 RepID=UPI0013EA7872|nr:TlpA disulfide reductase family protein [Dysgonomonas sp. ZJ709]